MQLYEIAVTPASLASALLHRVQCKVSPFFHECGGAAASGCRRFASSSPTKSRKTADSGPRRTGLLDSTTATSRSTIDRAEPTLDLPRAPPELDRSATCSPSIAPPQPLIQARRATMAPTPKQQPSLAGQRAIKHLIVDTGALIAAPVSSLRETATNYLVTSDVVQELRDKRGRNVLQEAQLQLPADTVTDGLERDELFREHEGFQVRDPTPESVAKSQFPRSLCHLASRETDLPRSRPVTAFARKTGDLAVLSSADIRVLALCLTLELEENGTWRVRDFPGQLLIPPNKEDKADGAEGSAKGKEKEEHPHAETDGQAAETAGTEDASEKLADAVAKVDLAADETSAASAAGATSDAAPHPSLNDDSSTPSAVSPSAASSLNAAPEGVVPGEPATDSAPRPARDGAADDDDGDVSDAESDSSTGSWITPDNVHAHKVRDLGLFEAPEASTSGSAAASTSTSNVSGAAAPAKAPKPKTIMKSAVLTGDFAMQNVALQMGLNVLGSGGKRVREVRTWVLRCHACFK